MIVRVERTSATLAFVTLSSILQTLIGYFHTEAQNQYTVIHMQYTAHARTHIHTGMHVHPYIRSLSGKRWLLCDTEQVAESTQFVEGKNHFLM